MADVLLEAESVLGKMLKSIPDKKASSGGGTCSLPNGITKKQSHEAQTIANNPEIVQKVKEEAKERGFIATPQSVYKEIKREEVSSRHS